jgi:lipid A disaccharide synthetase
MHNYPPLVNVARAIHRAFPDVRFLAPTTAATSQFVALYGGNNALDLPIETRQDAFDEMVPRCDLCLTVSGTATLHVAGFGVR